MLKVDYCNFKYPNQPQIAIWSANMLNGGSTFAIDAVVGFLNEHDAYAQYWATIERHWNNFNEISLSIADFVEYLHGAFAKQYPPQDDERRISKTAIQRWIAALGGVSRYSGKTKTLYIDMPPTYKEIVEKRYSKLPFQLIINESK